MAHENYNYSNHQETNYIELQSVNRGTLQNNEILIELRNLNNRINSLEQTHAKLLENLTNEIATLRNEVRELKSVSEEVPTNLLPKLPTEDLKSFKLFCEDLKNDDVCVQLKYLLGKVPAVDPPNFIRGAIKQLMVDDIATEFSWRGTNEKESIQKFIIISIIRNLCHSKFPMIDDGVINKTLQQHFVHAKDRIERRRKKN